MVVTVIDEVKQIYNALQLRLALLKKSTEEQL